MVDDKILLHAELYLPNRSVLLHRISFHRWFSPGLLMPSIVSHRECVEPRTIDQANCKIQSLYYLLLRMCHPCHHHHHLTPPLSHCHPLMLLYSFPSFLTCFLFVFTINRSKPSNVCCHEQEDENLKIWFINKSRRLTIGSLCWRIERENEHARPSDIQMSSPSVRSDTIQTLRMPSVDPSRKMNEAA